MGDNLKDTFLRLLAIGLWGNSKDTVDFSFLKEEEWLKLYRLGINHTVEGIIYDSFSVLPKRSLPPRSLLLKWTVRVDQIERHNEKMNMVIAEQQEFFSELNLKPILQKGQGVASCYENARHRVCGDIDWFFEGDDYDRAVLLLRKRGVELEFEANYSLSYQWNGVHVEHHRKLFDISSPFKQHYLRTLRSRFFARNQVLCFGETEVTILSPELQLLQITAHILKHLLSFGIGLRQICDAARLYYSYVGKVDGRCMKEIYQKVGILRWIHLLHATLVEYLDLPKECLPFSYPANTNADSMLEEIWYSGNFGFYDERFAEGRTFGGSKQPDGPRRLWLNFKHYVRSAPGEAFFFPIIYTFSKLSMKKGVKK